MCVFICKEKSRAGSSGAPQGARSVPSRAHQDPVLAKQGVGGRQLAPALPSPLCPCSPPRCRWCAGHRARPLLSPPCPGSPLPPGTATLRPPPPSSSHSPCTLRGQGWWELGVPVQSTSPVLTGQGAKPHGTKGDEGRGPVWGTSQRGLDPAESGAGSIPHPRAALSAGPCGPGSPAGCPPAP